MPHELMIKFKELLGHMAGSSISQIPGDLRWSMTDACSYTAINYVTTLHGGHCHFSKPTPWSCCRNTQLGSELLRIHSQSEPGFLWNTKGYHLSSSRDHFLEDHIQFCLVFNLLVFFFHAFSLCSSRLRLNSRPWLCLTCTGVRGTHHPASLTLCPLKGKELESVQTFLYFSEWFLYLNSLGRWQLCARHRDTIVAINIHAPVLQSSETKLNRGLERCLTG